MSHKPQGYNSVLRYLIVGGAARTIEFLSRVFGAAELRRYPGPGDADLHAEERLDDTVIMLADGTQARLPLPSHVHVRSPLRVRALLSFVCCWLAACGSPSPGNPKVPAGAKSSGGMHATIETDEGPIQIEFLAKEAPKAVENFRLLAEHGYYDGLTFHRIVKGFMIQGGDPSGDGTGGESAWGGTFEDEIDEASPLYRDGYRRGLVAMANAGPNTNGSQFFILHRDYPLPPNYVIFARVTAGMDVVDALADVPTTMGADGGMSKPVTAPIIRKVTIRP